MSALRVGLASGLAMAVWTAALAGCSGGGPPASGGDGAALDTPSSAGDADALGGVGDGHAPDASPDASGVEDASSPDGSDVDADAAEDGDGAIPPGDATSCPDDECRIDGHCYANGSVHPEDPCRQCRVLVDRLAWTPRDGASCDDGNPCTEDDRCLDGACSGDPVACDDGNPCTVGTCDPETGACSHEPVDGPCDDGDACTVDDHCEDGSCVGGGELDCDDGNPCTQDTCLPGSGCVHQAMDGAPCDDGNACTTNDTCQDGTCVGGDTLPCDDGNLCTVDACDPAEGCTHEPIPDLCDDGNPCTDDECDPDEGCVFPPNDDPCDDGDACTENDRCSGGTCEGEPIDVDDGNPCTNDSCDPDEGPVHTPNELPCDDGDPCTVGDQCQDGECVPGSESLDCDDGNPCTDDVCEPGVGCRNDPNDDPCDDGSACTKNDACVGGTCTGEPISCDDGNPCTEDTCDPASGCKHSLVLSEECRPTIVIEHPERGATLTGGGAPLVFVEGKVTSGAGAIESFTMNGQEVPLNPDGTFSIPHQGVIGGNILVFEATDELGTTRRRVQSYLWSPSYHRPVEPKSGMVDPGLGIFLGQEVLDDGDRTPPPDDFAHIFEIVIQNFDIAAAVGTGKVASAAGYDIYVSNIQTGDRSVSLESKTGRIEMTARIEDLSADIEADGTCLVCPDTSGVLEADAIVVEAEVSLSVNQSHGLDADLQNIQVDIQNPEVDGLGIGLGIVDTIINAIIPNFVSDIESSFEDEVASQIEPILQDSLSSLAIQRSFELPSLDPNGEPVAVDLVTDFSSITPQAKGVGVRLRTGVYAPTKSPHFDGDYRGAVGRSGCGTGFQELLLPTDFPLEIGFSDDMVNSLLFAAWKAGILEFDVPPSLLADVDLDQYGVEDLDVSVSGMLAPTLSDCHPGEEPRVHIGDIRIDATMDLFGQTMEVIVHASALARVNLGLQDGKLTLSIEEVERVETQVRVAQEDMLGSEGAVRDLIEEQLIPNVLTEIDGEALGGFPLPSIDLGETVDQVPAGTVIAIDVQQLIRENGTTIVQGELAQ